VEGRSGGLAILWNDKVKCKIVNYCRNFINVEVDEAEKGVWRLTCYYGYPERGRRRQAWDMLRDLRNMSSIPWCIIGDFNDLLSRRTKLDNTPIRIGCVQALGVQLTTVTLQTYNWKDIDL
jgi:hypothetical protein